MYDYSYYDTMDPGFASGIFATFDGMMMLFSSLIQIFMIICLWRLFTKAGKAGWKALIPIYNVIVLLEIAGLSALYIVLYFIPFVNIYALFKTYITLAHKFGKSTGFGVLMMFFSIVCVPILAFGNSTYQGGDHSENTVHTNTNMNTNNFNSNLNNYNNPVNQFNGSNNSINNLNSMNQANSGISSSVNNGNSIDNQTMMNSTASSVNNSVSQPASQMDDIFEMPTNLGSQQMSNQTPSSGSNTTPFTGMPTTSGSTNANTNINNAGGQSIYGNSTLNSNPETMSANTNINQVNNQMPKIDLTSNTGLNPINNQPMMNSTISSLDNSASQVQQPVVNNVTPNVTSNVGLETATKTCPNCGSQIKSDSSFCFMCGKQL